MTRLQDKTFIFGLGAQKAGTTWLADYLSTHPQVFMSPIKELHYFDLRDVPDVRPIQEAYFLKRMKTLASQVPDFDQIRAGRGAWRGLNNYVERFNMRSTDDYLRFFHRRIGDEKVFTEISPGYALLPAATYREVYELLDDVRFLFIMRDPLDRYWSNLRFYQGLLTGFDAKEQYLPSLKDRAIMGRTDYEGTITRLEQAGIPRGKCLFLFYETLFEESTIARLCRWMGVDTHQPDLEKRVFKSPEVPLPEEHLATAYDRLRPVYHALYKRTRGRLPVHWLNQMRRFGDLPRPQQAQEAR
ncbi:sulfotransferase [Yunchengibacter salinarum]|uniref:sulfotransferase n=1 Tax=Yunchengibacter salinarum TaxID=3133399 RepID=UPI0035B61798